MRMATRLEGTLRAAEQRSEPIFQALVRQLRRDYERGGQGFAVLLLAREQQAPCHELHSLMTCLSQRSGQAGDSKPMLLLLASLGLILSNLARLPFPADHQAAAIFDEMETIAATISV
jgi:hypothetical protein